MRVGGKGTWMVFRWAIDTGSTKVWQFWCAAVTGFGLKGTYLVV